MREILFRGKRIDNGEWVYGGYHKHDTVKICIAGDDPKTKHLIVADGFCDWGFEPPLMGYNVDPSTVGQYTGLCDKNGKKIFEGDIVKNGEHTMLVEWYKDHASFCLAFAVDGVYHETISSSDVYLEIIGNIQDDPELLEVSHE